MYKLLANLPDPRCGSQIDPNSLQKLYKFVSYPIHTRNFRKPSVHPFSVGRHLMLIRVMGLLEPIPTIIGPEARIQPGQVARVCSCISKKEIQKAYKNVFVASFNYVGK